MSSPKFFSPTNSQSEMLGHIPIMEGNVGHEDEGEGGADQDGSLCGRWEWEPAKPLLLLIQVMQVNGHPLPIGYHPVDVEVISDRYAIFELEPKIRAGEVAQLLHGIHEWDGQLAEIGCLLSTRRSIVNIVQERENGHPRLQQLEDEQRRVREEQQQHQEQLVTFLTQFQEEVRKVEKLQQSRTQEESISLQGAVGGMEEPRSIKPLILPPFSWSDPVPKDEASCEQWVWQAKEALKSCTVGVVRITIVQSVRGEVREFAATVGFEESVEMLLDKVEDRFGEKWTADGLQQEFYKITQGKNEKVRQFTGRLEAQFKKLKEKVPRHYDNSRTSVPWNASAT